MRVSKKKTKTITITALRVKILEAPEPLSVPIDNHNHLKVRSGDRVTIETDFDDLIRMVGTRIGGDDE